MMRRVQLLLTICLLSISSLHAQKRAFTLEDIYRVQSSSDVQVSPDGRSVIYVLTTSDLPRAKRLSHVWMMDIDGKNARQLTQGDNSASSPLFSPDGKWVSFLSAKDDSGNLYLMPATGGEAKKLTNVSTGVYDPLWSPDGKWIAFSTDVYPECNGDDACNKRIAEAWGNGPLQAHMADELLQRHWASWKDGTRTHIFVTNVATGETRDLTPGKFDAPMFQLGGPLQYDFSPDGTEFVYVSNHDKELATSTNNDLWLISLSDRDAKPRNVTASNPAYDGSPKYSPDGRYIAFRMQKQPGYESDLFRLALYDRSSNTSTVLTESFRNWIDDFRWSKDSKTIFFSSSVEGQNPIYRLDLASRTVARILADGTIDAFDFAPDDKSLVYIKRATASPPEVYRAEIGEGKANPAMRLTHINDAVANEVDLRPAEQMWVESTDGAKIHVFIIKPHNFDPNKKYPLILNIHGGPQQMSSDSFRGETQLFAGAGYILALPNPRGSTGYGQEFTAQISGDIGGQVFQDLMKVTDALEKLPYVDSTRMGAMGWSYGGYMMMWMEGHTDRFKALASMMGIYDWRSFYGATEELWWPQWDVKGQPWTSENFEKFSPSAYVRNFKTPALVISGERDYRVPYTQSLQFFTALQKMNVPSRLIIYSNAGHWPSWYEMALYYTAHLEWFNKHLGGDAPPWSTEQFLRNAVFDRQSGKRSAVQTGQNESDGSSKPDRPAEQEKKPDQTSPTPNTQGKPDAKPGTP
jgi:dipeptidyl aminopeptidase/acylaminoacyl peptidase